MNTPQTCLHAWFRADLRRRFLPLPAQRRALEQHLRESGHPEALLRPRYAVHAAVWGGRVLFAAALFWLARNPPKSYPNHQDPLPAIIIAASAMLLSLGANRLIKWRVDETTDPERGSDLR